MSKVLSLNAIVHKFKDLNRLKNQYKKKSLKKID